jgi:hypothetical protein
VTTGTQTKPFSNSNLSFNTCGKEEKKENHSEKLIVKESE